MHQEIVVSRSPQPAGRSRPAGFLALTLAAGAALFVPTAASARSAAPDIASASSSAQPGALRDGATWFAEGQGEAAFALIDLLATSEVDGIDSRPECP